MRLDRGAEVWYSVGTVKVVLWGFAFGETTRTQPYIPVVNKAPCCWVLPHTTLTGV